MSECSGLITLGSNMLNGTINTEQLPTFYPYFLLLLESQFHLLYQNKPWESVHLKRIFGVEELLINLYLKTSSVFKYSKVQEGIKQTKYRLFA